MENESERPFLVTNRLKQTAHHRVAKSEKNFVKKVKFVIVIIYVINHHHHFENRLKQTAHHIVATPKRRFVQILIMCTIIVILKT